jgi:hypothetical protein
MVMPILRAVPGASYYVNSRRCDATSSGEIHVHPAHRNDVVLLLIAGCVATSPWFHSVPPAPPKPAPPPKVKLKAKPYMTFAPDPDHSQVRYTADGEGHLDAAPEHVRALVRTGCVRA